VVPTFSVDTPAGVSFYLEWVSRSRSYLLPRDLVRGYCYSGPNG